ncbi:hypothetical protein CRG98_024779, partial [Punica granatum]
MAKRFGNKRGLKRTKKFENERSGGSRRKKNRAEEEVAWSSPDVQEADHAPAERLKSLSSEDVAVYKEPSMYDSLLVSLKSSNKSFSDAHERRQRQEEGRSDSEEDDIGGLESDAESQSEEDGSDE